MATLEETTEKLAKSTDELSDAADKLSASTADGGTDKPGPDLSKSTDELSDAADKLSESTDNLSDTVGVGNPDKLDPASGGAAGTEEKREEAEAATRSENYLKTIAEAVTGLADPGAAKTKAPAGPAGKSGLLSKIGGLFGSVGVGGGFMLGGLGALFAGGGYLIKALNDLDGEHIAKQIEALTNMKVGVLDAVVLAASLGAIGIGLAALGFGVAAVSIGEGIDSAVAGPAFQKFIGNEGPKEGWATRVKNDIETLLTIGQDYDGSPLLKSASLAIMMGALGAGLAAFGIGKAIGSIGDVISAGMNAGVEYFTDKKNTGFADRVKKEVETLLSIEAGIGKAAEVATSLTILGMGLAFFGIGKMVEGVGEAVGNLAVGAVDRFTGDESGNFADRIKYSVETLLSINAGVLKAAEIAVSLTILGIGLAFFGFGQMVEGVGKAVSDISTGAVDRFTGDESKPFADRIKYSVETIMSIDAKILKAAEIAASLTILGIGLAFFGFGKMVGEGAEAIKDITTSAVERFTGEESGNFADRIKYSVTTLLSINAGVLEAVKVAFALTTLGIGLAFFGIGKVVEGAGAAVTGVSSQALGLFTGKDNVGFGLRVKTEVENLLSINVTSIGNIAGIVVALTALGVGLAMFGIGKMVEGGGELVQTGAKAAGSALTDNPIYKEVGFGARIKKEVEDLLSIGDSDPNMSVLGAAGTFFLAMTGIAAGLAIFGVAKALEGVGGFLSNIASGEGKGFGERIKDEVDTLLLIGADADEAKADKLYRVLKRIGEAISSFADDKFGEALANLGTSVLNFFSGETSVTDQMIALADRAGDLSGAADAMSSLGVSLGKIGEIELGGGDKLNLEKMAEDLMDALPWFEGAIYGGAHAKKIGINLLGGSDQEKAYHEHGKGLLAMGDDVGIAAANLNTITKATANAASGNISQLSEISNIGAKIQGDPDVAAFAASVKEALPDLHAAMQGYGEGDDMVKGLGDPSLFKAYSQAGKNVNAFMGAFANIDFSGKEFMGSENFQDFASDLWSGIDELQKAINGDPDDDDNLGLASPKIKWPEAAENISVLLNALSGTGANVGARITPASVAATAEAEGRVTAGGTTLIQANAGGNTSNMTLERTGMSSNHPVIAHLAKAE